MVIVHAHTRGYTEPIIFILFSSLSHFSCRLFNVFYVFQYTSNRPKKYLTNKSYHTIIGISIQYDDIHNVCDLAFECQQSKSRIFFNIFDILDLEMLESTPRSTSYHVFNGR